MNWWKKITRYFSPEPEVHLVPLRAGSEWGRVQNKRDMYIRKSKEVRDEHGFIPGCDSLIFTSLSVVGGYPARLEAAESNGKWYRCPTKDCYSSGRSKSTISRDMLCGLLWATYHQKDVERLRRFISRSETRLWNIGEGELSRTIVTPQIQKLTADVLDKLGGGNLRRYRVMPHIYPSGLDGYEAHLQVLQILLRLHMYGKISRTMADRIEEHHQRNNFNVLFSLGHHLISDGNLEKPTEMLMGLSQLPNAKLPDNTCRSTEYLWQRDHNDDWYAQDKHEVYSGSDLIFAAGLIKKFLER